MSDLQSPRLSEKQFQIISELMYRKCGVNLQSHKHDLVKSRLAKRLRALGLSSFDQYIDYVARNKTIEIVELIDALTTNKTDFFRESQHLDYFSQQVLPQFERQRRLRLWSAGCSSGEEPYSLAMTLLEAIPQIDQWDIAILATDISNKVLRQAKSAAYEPEKVQDMPLDLLRKYFERRATETGQEVFQVVPRVRRLVKIAHLNLMDAWPMRGPFDAIFCRNVMIYFDKKTQERLIHRFAGLLPSGGYLFVGHSESLTGIPHPFQYIQPAVYQKP